jgi:hypothetical protein
MRWPGWASGPWAQAMTVTGEEQVICVSTWNMSSSRTLKPALYCFAKYQRNHVSRKLLEWYGCRRWMRRRLFFLRKRGDRDFFFLRTDATEIFFPPRKLQLCPAVCCGIRASSHVFTAMEEEQESLISSRNLINHSLSCLCLSCKSLCYPHATAFFLLSTNKLGVNGSE